MLCYTVLAVLLLLAPLKPIHSRSLHTPDRAVQVIEQLLERYNDILTLDDLANLTSDQSEEPVQTGLNSGLTVAENPKWIDVPEQNENSWVRILKGALANQKRALSERSRRGWNRGCFGLKLDRIGSMSGLGC